MTLQRALKSGLARADEANSTKVKADHFPEADLEEVLRACFGFLEAKAVGPSSTRDGWSVTTGVPGLRRWLAGEAGLAGAAGNRFQLLRTEIYDLLEERGWIVKGPGHNVPIHIAPAGIGRDVKAASEVITVSSHGAGYGDQATNVEVELAAMELAT